MKICAPPAVIGKRKGCIGNVDSELKGEGNNWWIVALLVLGFVVVDPVFLSLFSVHQFSGFFSEFPWTKS